LSSRQVRLTPGDSEGVAYVALGSNLGDRAGSIGAALEMLSQTPGVAAVRASALLENPAVGLPPGSPPFLNGVAEVRTALGARALLERLLEIERSLGRERTRKWGSRPIDLDLLLFGGGVIDEPDLKLPHPRMHERRFVLEPLAELAPGAVHPTLGKPIAALLAELRS
jgi:2-amino-4-hydroxy-6-hydroxymethyldihydropteridine diphosphokinase